MRDQVYLENERYFQAGKAEQQPKIVESEEENNSHDNVEKDDDTSFHEAVPLMETVENTALLIKDHNEEELSDNDDVFEEALSTLPNEDVQPEVANLNALPSHMDPFLLVVTESSLEMSLPLDAENKAPVSPRELLATLEEIKHSFRAQLEPEQSPAESPVRSKALHGKGRAPPPPLPPRRDSSRDSMGSTKSGIGQLFKTIKDNVLRTGSSSSTSSSGGGHKANPDEELSGAKETCI